MKKIIIETSDDTLIHVNGQHVTINGHDVSDALNDVKIERYMDNAIARLSFYGKMVK
ncbi:hypothetical protein STRDD10_02050 [Streptococcus sp. DD10]|uniref:hypothetical protein n=1 Tax=Streptococcus sp. DD10 TaxID=1777878 RepID=UPI00079C42D8|nr:hypothetical protein [Streptococcus sp. DD10]KXT71703.1 hypothetical protein STRDD10_02050 [Streptococcus sp. DD10]